MRNNLELRKSGIGAHIEFDFSKLSETSLGNLTKRAAMYIPEFVLSLEKETFVDDEWVYRKILEIRELYYVDKHIIQIYEERNFDTALKFRISMDNRCVNVIKALRHAHPEWKMNDG